MTYLDAWRSGTFLLYSCKAAFWIQETSLRLSDVEHSDILPSVFAISSALAYLLFFQECATPLYIQVRHTTWLSFTGPSPRISTASDKRWGERPGYEARLALLVPRMHDDIITMMSSCILAWASVQVSRTRTIGWSRSKWGVRLSNVLWSLMLGLCLVLLHKINCNCWNCTNCWRYKWYTTWG